MLLADLDQATAGGVSNAGAGLGNAFMAAVTDAQRLGAESLAPAASDAQQVQGQIGAAGSQALQAGGQLTSALQGALSQLQGRGGAFLGSLPSQLSSLPSQLPGALAPAAANLGILSMLSQLQTQGGALLGSLPAQLPAGLAPAAADLGILSVFSQLQSRGGALLGSLPAQLPGGGLPPAADALGNVQQLASDLAARIDSALPQGLSSALTYGRRLQQVPEPAHATSRMHA
jgi:hypothetical protein